MGIVVQKYGGSSVADAAGVKRVAQRIVNTKKAGHQVVVVVSAMGDTTDELLALAKQVSPDPPRRELDMLLTCGERISMALLSMALQEQGVPAISFTGSQSGIITDDAHSQARIVEVRPYRIQDELAMPMRVPSGRSRKRITDASTRRPLSPARRPMAVPPSTPIACPRPSRTPHAGTVVVRFPTTSRMALSAALRTISSGSRTLIR